MAVLGEQYEVVITVKRRDSPSAPYGIKFYVADVYSNKHYWRDAKIMMGLAQQVLTNFAKVFLQAVK